tara:strand:+ start:408 stop:1325 length:918 start_codon:yes stop_codon:yes gene_type:complete
MKRKILLTGVAGFIGSSLATRLLDEGFKVYGVDDLSRGKENSIPKKVEFIKLDISNNKKFNKLPKDCNSILHLAGQSSGEISFENPLDDLKKNTASTLNLINYGIQSKVKKIIFASSMSVYGNYKKKLDERLTLRPLSCYGVSKLASENYLKIFSKKIPYVNLRMFNVYGPGQDLNNLKQGMVSIYLAQAIDKNKIIVKGSLNRVRDLIYIDDVVEVWFKTLTNNSMLNNDFNVGTGSPTSVRKLISIIKKHFIGCKIDVQKNTPGDQDFVCSNNKKLLKIINTKKFLNISSGIKKYMDFINEKY